MNMTVSHLKSKNSILIECQMICKMLIFLLLFVDTLCKIS